MKIGNREFDTLHHTYVMGILNVTPDSFSDGGKWNTIDNALFHVEKMIEEGVDIVDVGGESTRPGFVQISDEEEIKRVVPVIEALKARFDVPVSLDTYKSKVAEAGILAGADLINDIWGLKYDETMASVIAKSDLPCCLMHNRSVAGKDDFGYVDFMQDMAADLAQTLQIAAKAGISEGKIILDPGVGFGKSYENNLEVINCLEELKMLGCPVLLGCSRKSVIGLTLDLPADQRVEGTLVTTVFGVIKGCSFVRVHDVKENVRAIRMAEAILGRVEKGFTKTRIPMKNIFATSPVSRSQAKQVCNRLEKFNEVLLDFEGIKWMGQGFAHQLFVVFASDHPDIELVPINMNEDLTKMYRHVTQ